MLSLVYHKIQNTVFFTVSDSILTQNMLHDEAFNIHVLYVFNIILYFINSSVISEKRFYCILIDPKAKQCFYRIYIWH